LCKTSDALSVENGEPCFESIEIDDKQVPNTQIIVSSGTTEQISTNTNTIFTGWIHDATDLTPWILVCIIHVKMYSLIKEKNDNTLSNTLNGNKLFLLHLTINAF
jgi:hypothetical protein